MVFPYLGTIVIVLAIRLLFRRNSQATPSVFSDIRICKKIISRHQKTIFVSIDSDAKENEKVRMSHIKTLNYPSPGNWRIFQLGFWMSICLRIFYLECFIREMRRVADIVPSRCGRSYLCSKPCSNLNLKRLKVGLFTKHMPTAWTNNRSGVELAVHLPLILFNSQKYIIPFGGS